MFFDSNIFYFFFFFFFFNDTATTEIYTLSLHDALPISVLVERPGDALTALLLVVDDVVFPAQLGLADVEHEIVGRLPDLAKRRPDVVDGALIDGVVRQVELGGPDQDRKSTRLNSSHSQI